MKSTVRGFAVLMALLPLMIAACATQSTRGIPSMEISGERVFLRFESAIPLTPNWNARFPDNMQVRFWTKGVTDDFSSIVRYIGAEKGPYQFFSFPDGTMLSPTPLTAVEKDRVQLIISKGQQTKIRGKVFGLIIPNSGIWLAADGSEKLFEKRQYLLGLCTSRN